MGHHQPRSIIIVSERVSFSQEISGVFSMEDNNTITTANESFKMMNGRAGSLVFDQDVVIFEADPDDADEIQAVKELLKKRTNGTIFLALTGNEVSITKARELKKIGIDEVLPLSIDSDGIRAAVDEKLSAMRAPEQNLFNGFSALGQVIPVTQSRGGIGSTTIAVNLASTLVGRDKTMFKKATRKSVVLLDLDLQFGNSNVFLDLEDKGGFLNIIDSAEKVDERFVGSTLQRHALGFDVLCAPAQVVPLHSMRPDLVQDIIEILKMKYDYIIIDLPRAVVDWVEPVLKSASKLVIVTDTSVPCVRQARRLMDLYREDSVALPVEVVVNRERRPMLKSEHVREAEKVLETKLIHWLPDNPKVARSAVDLGRPIVDMKPKSDLGKALTLLASALSDSEQTVNRKKIRR